MYADVGCGFSLNYKGFLMVLVNYVYLVVSAYVSSRAARCVLDLFNCKAVRVGTI